MGKTNNNQHCQATASRRKAPRILRISDYRSPQPPATLTIAQRAQQQLQSWEAKLDDAQRSDLAVSPEWEQLISGKMGAVLVQRLRQMIVDREHYSLEQIKELLTALPPGITDSKRFMQLWGAGRCRYFSQQLSDPGVVDVGMLNPEQESILLQRLSASEQALASGNETRRKSLIEQLHEDIADYDDQIDDCYQPNEGPDSIMQSWPLEGMQACTEGLLEMVEADQETLLADNDLKSFSSFLSQLLLHPTKVTGGDSRYQRLLRYRKLWAQAEQQQLVQLLRDLNP